MNNLLLPLKAARTNATANLNIFGAQRHQQPDFDGFIHIRYAAPPYSTGISAIYLLPFGKLAFESNSYHTRMCDTTVSYASITFLFL